MGGLQSRPAKEADALTISVILLLQEVMTVSGRDTSYPAHIVGMVRTALHSQHRAWQQSSEGATHIGYDHVLPSAMHRASPQAQPSCTPAVKLQSAAGLLCCHDACMTLLQSQLAIWQVPMFHISSALVFLKSKACV